MQLSITMATIFDMGSYYKAQRDFIAKRCVCVQCDAYLKWTRSLTFDLRDQYWLPCTSNLVYEGELLPFRVELTKSEFQSDSYVLAIDYIQTN